MPVVVGFPRLNRLDLALAVAAVGGGQPFGPKKFHGGGDARIQGLENGGKLGFWHHHSIERKPARKPWKSLS